MTDDGVTDYLSLDDLLEIAEDIVDVVHVRDLGLLASAAARPQTSAFGDVAYPTLVDKAAALMLSIAPNHALVDGNMRLAWAATRVFLIMNGADLALRSMTPSNWCPELLVASSMDPTWRRIWLDI